MSKTVTTTTTGEIAQIERVATSRNGNPTYRVYLTDGRSFLTETDGSVGYSVTNYRPRRGESSTPVVLTIYGKRERITSITRPDGSEI